MSYTTMNFHSRNKYKKPNLTRILSNRENIHNFPLVKRAINSIHYQRKHVFSIRSRFNYKDDDLTRDYKGKSFSVKDKNTGDPAKDIENMLDNYYRSSSKTSSDFRMFNRENAEFNEAYRMFQKRTEKDTNLVERRNLFKTSPLMIFDKDEMRMYYMVNKDKAMHPEKDKAKVYLDKIRERIMEKMRYNKEEGYFGYNSYINNDNEELDEEIEANKRSIQKTKSAIDILNTSKVFLFEKYDPLPKVLHKTQIKKDCPIKILKKQKSEKGYLLHHFIPIEKKKRNSTFSATTPDTTMQSINKTKSTNYKDKDSNLNNIHFLYDIFKNEALSASASKIIENYFKENGITVNKVISKEEILNLFKIIVNKTECFNYEENIKKFYMNHTPKYNIKHNIGIIGEMEKILKSTDLLYCKSLIGCQLKKE